MPKSKVSKTAPKASGRSRSQTEETEEPTSALTNPGEKSDAPTTGTGGLPVSAPGPEGNGQPVAAQLGANGPVGAVVVKIEISEKVKELVRLAQEQGYLTYNDINEILPDSVISPEELDDIYIK